MSFDALTLAAVRDELAPLLTGARIQKVVFVDELSLALEVFAPGVGRTQVLLSGHLDRARIHAIRQLPARGVEHDSPFGLLVRKHLRHARVRSVDQPRLERVFELDCEQRDPSERHYRVVLIVEAMGRRSNLLLVDADGVILDAARRTPPSRNARRPVLPHLPYTPPPPQDRLMPEEISVETLALAASGPLDRWLAQRVAGVSPRTAREIAFRATGSTSPASDGVDWPHLVATTRAFLAMFDRHTAGEPGAEFPSGTESTAEAPTVAFDSEARPVDYAPYELTHLAAEGDRVATYPTISQAIEDYHARLPQGGPARRGDPLAAERKALLLPIDRATRSTERRVAALEHQLTTGQTDRDPLRAAGDAILAHLTEIPEAASEVVVDGERIELDPRLSPIENAQAYFARYRKARETEARVPALLQEARQTADHLADLRTLVEVADQMDAIRALRREVAAVTGSNPRTDSKKSSKAAAYRRVPMADGWEALVGTSAAGNATVTFDLARGEDLWLHARGVPGAHVVLRGQGQPAPEVVERGAELAASHSAARQATTVDVDVTLKRYVKKISG
ncbi:MAG: NFACT family protein, partial [Chloroflexi bacterium]|nr:NFACT family protein [Chloroflexota bacterium]